MEDFDPNLLSQIKQQPEARGQLNIWLGGKIRLMINSGGAVNPAVRSTLRKAIGAPMIVSYGCNETCGPATMTYVTDVRSGHVGGIGVQFDMKLIDIPEMSFSSLNKNSQGFSQPQGEICLRGPGVVKQYFKSVGRSV